ncbi:CHASE2 domain-containing protein [Rhizobium sp. KVB221]|uniref:CHASE2 domain-containing protein n=1 Tax=Rhizobium setariae TaxID=2801340 RepID=A0A936YUT4_9HYPH|nr:CHASE2 domain-containing protein [Rhizobium setariae]MBL0375124.1 CHASE2 domain-containing protein [Rhizobium setariae]
MTFRFRPFHMGILASLIAALMVVVLPETLLEGGRELYFDRLTQLFPPRHSDDIVVVDIDRKAFSSVGDQKWQRANTAALIDKIAVQKPAVIAFDLVFSTDCDTAAPANQALAAALSRAPTLLGFLLSDVEGAAPQPLPPLAIAKSLTVPEIWFLPGAETSCPVFQKAAASSAASFLIGDEDSRVRRVQAFSIVGADPFPALGLEAVRRYLKIKTPILGGTPPWLKLGRDLFSLAEDGSLRFVASDQAEIARRTVSAADVLVDNPPRDYFEGKIVFIGSSMPNLGGLRGSAAEPLVASVQIHADLANSLIQKFVPTRHDWFVDWEAGYVLLAGLLIALLTVRFRPWAIALGGVAVIAMSLGLSALMYSRAAWLIDGFTVALALALVLLVAAFSQFAETRRAERVARQRFSQYLPQSVVDRYIDNPNARPMAGEDRQVTALFTDIEAFSNLAGRVSPHVLVGLLNVYFAEVTKLVSDHGGMVDKIVGDAVHAFFNAPEDLENHVDKAIECALAIFRLTEEMRERLDFKVQEFGRTRIGIETGMAVLGEVGIAGKLDYTAHGNAINLAARLQDANKFLGTTICVGPAAEKESARPLRPLGKHEIRGFGTMELFTADDLMKMT